MPDNPLCSTRQVLGARVSRHVAQLTAPRRMQTMREVGSTTIAFVSAVALALLGYLATYGNNLILERRKARLERINQQLSDFYGPLLALVASTNLLFQRWRQTEFKLQSWANASEQDKEQWRMWMSTAFMPLNRRMAEIITTKAHLIEEDHMPPELLAFCAHVSAYEVLLQRWANGDLSRMIPYILFPTPIIRYAEESFGRLKHRQDQLLRQKGVRTDEQAPASLGEFMVMYPALFEDAQSERALPTSGVANPPDST